MSWRPLTEILPVVDAGAARAAIVATGGIPPQQAPAAPSQLFRAGLSPRETQEAQAQEQERESEQERRRKVAYEEGMSLARAEGEALALRYRAAIEELAHAREQAIKACEADLVRLSLTIAREVLMADVPGREQYTERMAEHAINLLQGSQSTTLRMCAKDAAQLRQHKPELLRRSDVVLMEDDSLQMGGVVAEGAKGRVDATFEARLRAMAEKLLPQNEVLA